MKNAEKILSLLNAPGFNERLIEQNETAVRYYNEELGFDELKERMKDLRAMSPEQIFAMCDEFFTFERVKLIIAKERECAEANPLYASSFQPVEGSFFSGLVLVATDQFTAILMSMDGYEIELSKQRKPGQKRSLTFAGLPASLHFYRAHEVELARWRIPSFVDEDDLARSDIRPERVGSRIYSSGDRASFGNFETFEYNSKAGSSALCLQVQMHQGGAPMSLQFDIDTLKLIGASSPSQEPTRLQMLATAMRMFGRTDAMEEMESLLSHPSHYVRWHAMRECIGIDAAWAHPRLIQMSEQDPQPAVRRAASATLKQFFPPELVAAAA
jgi:hypothetical protein